MGRRVPVPSLLLLHLLLTCALVGLVWTVQVVVYPGFEGVGRAEFPAWHAAYTTRIGWVVGPTMLAELSSALWLLAQGLRAPAFLVSVGLLALVWLSTALLQVPLHQRLAQGFDATSHQRLVRTNWLRTLAWSGRAGCLLFCL